MLLAVCREPREKQEIKGVKIRCEEIRSNPFQQEIKSVEICFVQENRRLDVRRLGPIRFNKKIGDRHVANQDLANLGQ
jgi:hypothetical protein